MSPVKLSLFNRDDDDRRRRSRSTTQLVGRPASGGRRDTPDLTLRGALREGLAARRRQAAGPGGGQQ